MKQLSQNSSWLFLETLCQSNTHRLAIFLRTGCGNEKTGKSDDRLPYSAPHPKSQEQKATLEKTFLYLENHHNIISQDTLLRPAMLTSVCICHIQCKPQHVTHFMKRHRCLDLSMKRVPDHRRWRRLSFFFFF